MKENPRIEIIKKIGIGVFFSIFIYYMYINSIQNDKPASIHNKEVCLKCKQTIYSGIVLNNYTSRGSFISRLNNKTSYKWWCKSKARDIIEVGDSIYKPAGTFDTYIFKQANLDSVIFVECDFDCDYWIKRYGTE